MNYIDILVIIVFGAGAIGGLMKGLVKEVGGLAALFIAIVGAKILAPVVLPFFAGTLKLSEQWAQFWAWAASFLTIALVVNLIAVAVTGLLSMIALGGINKLLGAVFGGLKYILLFSILFNMIAWAEQYVPVPGEKARQESLLYEPVRKMAGWSIDFLKGHQRHLSNKKPMTNV